MTTGLLPTSPCRPSTSKRAPGGRPRLHDIQLWSRSRSFAGRQPARSPSERVAAVTCWYRFTIRLLHRSDEVHDCGVAPFEPAGEAGFQLQVGSVRGPSTSSLQWRAGRLRRASGVRRFAALPSAFLRKV